MNDSQWNWLRDKQLQWLPDLGIGWYPVTAQPYDANYWEDYRARDASPQGARLTELRRNLVDSYWDDAVVDVGIGGGRFVLEQPNAMGYDINPHAVAWLQERGAWHDPSLARIGAATFWDSLEHIHDPGPILRNVGRFVFTSLPIFTGIGHVRRSKHFKTDEHCWYFTRNGIVCFMSRYGFELVYEDRREEFCREDIGTFVFRRRAA